MQDISSKVPKPPGKAMNASAMSNMNAIRSGILHTVSSFPIVVLHDPFSLNALGITPKTEHPLLFADVATVPIKPIIPPPYISEIFSLASASPNLTAISVKALSFPGLDPQKTQIVLYFLV